MKQREQGKLGKLGTEMFVMRSQRDRINVHCGQGVMS
jgi:hypothetical protein